MTAFKLNRRKWLRATSVLATGMAVAPAGTLAANAYTHKTSETKLDFKTWEWETRKPFKIDPSKIKARLLANENPYGPSDKTRLAIMESVSSGNRYGHMDAAKLRKMIAEKEGVTEESILLGPGSTDILEKVAITHFIEGGNIVAADPAYMALIKTAVAFKASWKAVPLTDTWAHDLTAMEAAIDNDTQLVYICNPNNPTGSLTDGQALWDFCNRVADKVPVFVDEAYLEFMDPATAKSMVGLVNKGKNVIIARTFSKIHGMAGLRVGYGVALPETLEMITSMVRSNMGMSVTSLRGAMASFEDTAFQQMSRRLNTECREYTIDALKQLGFDPVSSATSFVLFPIAMEGDTFLEKMYGHGLGVRSFQIMDKPHCRVSIGTMDEMKLFIEGIKKVLV
ncbi:MAG: histidinol-phosphate transaminase [Bacteroidota bacterium]